MEHTKKEDFFKYSIAEATGRTLGKGGKGQYETNVAFSVPLFSYTMPGVNFMNVL
jgi:hypothetical protein